MVRYDPYSPGKPLYECPKCGFRADRAEYAGSCPGCGEAMKNISVPRE